MSVNYTDFDKIWASTSPLTPYEFSESQYKEGWNFVGATPPSRQMWDAFMKNADEKLQYLYNHESVPVGHEYFTFNPNVPQGSLPLFGGEYSRETYSALWNWVQQQTGYLKTEAEWQQIYTTNAGNVPYYSDGDGSTTFRVPSLKCWVKGANGTVSEVGSYLAAGLPNIIGEAGLQDISGTGFSTTDFNGAFTYSKTSNYTVLGQERVATGNLKLDASLSNPIYGNSTTVQPPSIIGMWLVKAYGVIVDTGQIDEQQYIDDRMADLKNVYLPANYIPFAKGIDLSIFADYQSFTKPTVNGGRVDIIGGYKKVGNIVYVYMHMHPLVSTMSAAGTWKIVYDLPSPIFQQPLILGVDLGDNTYSGNVTSAYINGAGALYVVLAEGIVADSTTSRGIYVQGIYLTA